MSLRAAVIRFPGSNCDHDALRALSETSGVSAEYHWHEDEVPKNRYQLIVIPGGFSFGDYLRAGAIAKLSKAMLSLPEAVDAGAHVLGICNGFQILLEARLLPGYLQVNSHLRFVSRQTELRIEKKAFPWIGQKDLGKTLRVPIAHRFGNFQVGKMDLPELDVVFKYTQNPNGSFQDIAGIYRPVGQGSIMGMMPHPERASFPALGLADGRMLWKNAVEALS